MTWLSLPSKSLAQGVDANTLKVWSTGDIPATIKKIKIFASKEAGILNRTVMPDGTLSPVVQASSMAYVLSESRARVAENSAIAGEITVVKAAVNSNVADIVSETAARVSADSAMAFDITALESTVNDAETGVAVTANGLESLDTRVTTSEDNITTSASKITALETTVDDEATGVAAQGTAITALDVRITDNEGGLTSQAESISVLETGVGDNTAAISTEATTRATADTALSEAITTVQSTAGGNTTAISANLTSINGIEGKYAVKIDNNGYVSGFGLISTDNDGVPTSEFILLSDKFSIVKPGAEVGETPMVPFVVGDVDGVSAVGVNGNLLVDGSILAHAIQADAIKAAHIDTNEIFVGLKMQSTNYVEGITGWKIEGGLAEFNSIVMKFTAGSSGYDNLTDKPTSLNDINSGEYNIIQNSIESWFDDGVPTLSNVPAVDWTTTALKDQHLGDLYYDNLTGYAYRFRVVSTTYSWLKLTDSDITAALAAAATAQDTADGKRRVFLPVSNPVPPYDAGDLWDTGAGVKRCQTAKAEGGAYASDEWIGVADVTDYDTINTYADNAARLIFSSDPDEAVNINTDIDGADEFEFSVDLLSEGSLIHIEYEGTDNLSVALNETQLEQDLLTSTDNYGDLDSGSAFNDEPETNQYIDLSLKSGAGEYDYGTVI